MKTNKNTRVMANILMVIFILIFLVIMGRFLYIQISGEIDNVSLADWAKEKRMSTYYLHSERGKIIDSNGMVLAQDRLKYKIFAVVAGNIEDKKNYKYIEDVNEAAKLIAPILDVDKAFILERLNNGIDNKRYQVEFGEIGKNLSRKIKDEIEDLKIPGINFEEKSTRYYPNGELASHVLGFARVESRVKEDSDEVIEEIIGITGLENELNELLKGEDGYVSFQRDKYNRKLLDPEEFVKKPTNGNEIHLTIDQKIQVLLEDVMNEVEEEYTPNRMTAVIMHAKTGEILAMSNRPNYDPNNPIGVDNWYNDVISTPTEPGSTMKMFTWAAAIDAGVYTGEEMYESGSYRVTPRSSRVRDYNGGRGWGKISYNEGFIRSSNVAASKVMWEQLGPDLFLDYLKAFDFDKKSGIDLPGEVLGRIQYTYPIEQITASFGQGSTFTPIQQLKAATAITNKGKMLQPFIIKKIINSDTQTIEQENEPQVVGEPISEKTAEEVKKLLDAVVNSEEGTGKPYRLDSYSVIGKTGTSQISNPDTSKPGYLSGHGNHMYSFLGMAPKEDPELIMFVSVKQPNLEPFEAGSAPAAHIFKSVMDHSLHLLNVIPDLDENDQVEKITIPNLIGEKTEKIQNKLGQQNVKVTVIGNGENVIKSSGKKGDEVLTHDHIILVTDKPTMPDIIGWSLRDVQKLAALMDIKIESFGSGYVLTQSIKVGNKIKQQDYLGIELMPPDLKKKKQNDSSLLENEDENRQDYDLDQNEDDNSVQE